MSSETMANAARGHTSEIDACHIPEIGTEQKNRTQAGHPGPAGIGTPTADLGHDRNTDRERLSEACPSRVTGDDLHGTAHATRNLGADRVVGLDRE